VQCAHAPSSLDLAGKPLLLGARRDIGAYEDEVIIVEGFER
jgi:hypothetical protein